MTFTDQQPTTAEIPLLQTAFPTYRKSQDQPVPVSKLSSNTSFKAFCKSDLESVRINAALQNSFNVYSI